MVVYLYQGNNSLLVLHILFPHHGVGLASTRLTISKDADIVAFKGVKQHFLSDVFVHLLLRCIIDVLGLWTERPSKIYISPKVGTKKKIQNQCKHVRMLWLGCRGAE